jgi:hypothetical protein
LLGAAAVGTARIAAMVRALVVAAFLLAFAPAAAVAAPRPVGVVGETLGRFDRDSLALSGEGTPVLEPHAPGVLSPDGRRVAMGLSMAPPAGVSGRIGLWIVDSKTLHVVHAVPTGIAAEQVAYPGVVAALLQSGALVVVNPDTGEITHRYELHTGSICTARPASYPGGAVFLLAGSPLRLANVDAAGRVHIVTLGRLRSANCSSFALAVDPARRQAYVAAGDKVAEVALATRHVRYHAVRGSRTGRRVARWVPGAGLAVAGGGKLRLLDPRTWRTRWSVPGATGVAVTGTSVLAVGDGVRAYSYSGRLRYRALRGETIDALELAAGRAYAQSLQHVTVLDAATGAVRARLAQLFTRPWLL